MNNIYVAESGDGYCKIGKSDNPENRMRQIELSSGLRITRWKEFSCNSDSLKTERLAQKEASQHHVFGEWFAISFEEAVEICRNASLTSNINENNDKQKVIPQWIPTINQRKHLAYKAAEEGTTITGYIKQLVNADMRKNK